MEQAIGYCRVSDPRQVKEEGSLDRQEHEVRNLALKRGYEMVRVFIERGESAKTDDRTALKQMLSFAKKEKVTALIVPKIDRLARNSHDYLSIKMLLARSGVRIESVGENIEDSPVGRFMETVLSGTAQLDNEIRAERSRNGQIDAFKQGRWVWPAPYGFEHKNKNISPKEPEANLMRTIFERSQGLTKAQAYDMAKKLGFPLSRTRFYEILHNPVYAGTMRAFGMEVKGTFEPLVPEHLIHCVKRQAPHLVSNPDFPLKPLCRCCGTLTGSWASGRSAKYPYYRCRTCGHNFPKEKVEAAFVTFLDTFAIPEHLAVSLPERMRQCLGSTLERERKRQQAAARELTQNRELQRNIALKNAAGVIPDDLAAKEIQRLREEEANLAEPREANNFSFESLVENALEVLVEPGQYWLKETHVNRLRFQSIIFPDGVNLTKRLAFGTKKMRLLEPASRLVGPHSSALVAQADETWNLLIDDLKAFHHEMEEADATEQEVPNHLENPGCSLDNRRQERLSRAQVRVFPSDEQYFRV